MTRAIRIGAWLAVVTASSAARAQPAPPVDAPAFGARGEAVLSMERLLGIQHVWQREDVNGSLAQTFRSTSVWALSQAQLGADFFIHSSLSVGGAVGFSRNSQSFHPTGGIASDQTVTSVQVSPRLGYAVHLARRLWLWPRAGVTFAYRSSDLPNITTGGRGTFWGYSLTGTADAPVAAEVLPRLFVTVGPLVDLTFLNHFVAGGDGVSADSVYVTRTFDIGLVGGLSVLL